MLEISEVREHFCDFISSKGELLGKANVYNIRHFMLRSNLRKCQHVEYNNMKNNMSQPRHVILSFSSLKKVNLHLLYQTYIQYTRGLILEPLSSS